MFPGPAALSQLAEESYAAASFVSGHHAELLGVRPRLCQVTLWASAEQFVAARSAVSPG